MGRNKNFDKTLKQDKKTIKGISEEYSTRREREKEMRELRSMLKTRKNEILQRQRRQRIERIENEKRKEENRLKSETYDVIKNPEKIKKWKHKARKLIRKMPQDIFYNKYFNKD